MRLVCVFPLLIASIALSAQITELTIPNRSGVARLEEPLTMGIPLPANGNYTDASLFTLRDSNGSTIPCEFTRTCSWFRTPEKIRWLQVNFPVSLDSGEVKKVYLHSETTPYALSTNLTATDNGASIEVNTGKLRFTVKKSKFNLVDEAWINGTKIVASHSNGIVNLVGSNEYKSSNDSASVVAIERSGTGIVVIKATGKLKTVSGDSSLAFTTRIYAYHNSSTIKIQNTVANTVANAALYINLQAVKLEIPLILDNKKVLLGSPGRIDTYNLGQNDEAYMHVTRPPSSAHPSMGVSMSVQYGGAATGTSFNPALNKPKDIGWIALTDGSKGCVTGMKYFWQMVPTSIEATGSGILRVSPLSNRRSSNPLLAFYSGTARTSETKWTFFDSNATDDEIRGWGVMAVERSYAFAPKEWYTRATNAVMPLVEANNPDLYPSHLRSSIANIETKLSNIWSIVLASDNNVNFNYDSYGFLSWGDNPHASNGLSAPFNTLWNGNYYGLDFFAFSHFLVTGDLRFFDYAVAHTQHVYDVHQCHFENDNNANGSNRYCPSSYHIAVEDGTPSVGNTSHHKTEAMFINYYLTGDDYSIEAAMEAAKNCNGYGYSLASGPSDNISTYIRRWAHVMNTVYWAYMHTLDNKYYSQLWMNWEIFKRNIANNNPIGQDFMVGLATETTVKLYDVLSPGYPYRTFTPDSIPYYLKRWVDRANSETFANNTMANAFLSRFYGSVYASTALSKASSLPDVPNNLHKNFAQQARNVEMGLYYLAIRDSIQAEIAVEQGISRKNQTRMTISATPNPFNPSTHVLISGLSTDNKPVKLSIFSTNGTLLRNYLLNKTATLAEAEIDASDYGTGVYLIKCTDGARTTALKVSLIR